MKWITNDVNLHQINNAENNFTENNIYQAGNIGQIETCRKVLELKWNYQKDGIVLKFKGIVITAQHL